MMKKYWGIEFLDDNGDVVATSVFTTFATSELDCQIQGAEIAALFR
jgi:hypothetical protein